MAAVFPQDTTQPWNNNDVTYKYDASEDRWYVVSTTATDQVVGDIVDLNNELNDLDLQKVLDNGNVADKDIVLTDAVDDLIDISPTEGRIVIAVMLMLKRLNLLWLTLVTTMKVTAKLKSN